MMVVKAKQEVESNVIAHNNLATKITHTPSRKNIFMDNVQNVAKAQRTHDRKRMMLPAKGLFEENQRRRSNFTIG